MIKIEKCVMTEIIEKPRNQAEASVATWKWEKNSEY